MKEKIQTSLMFVLVAVMLGIGYQNYKLQQTNHKIHKAAANMALKITNLDNVVSDLKSSFNKITNPGTASLLAVGDAAPDFKLPNDKSLEVSLASLESKKKLLVFSSVDCHYCKEYLPKLQEFTAEKQEDLEVVLIQVGSEAKDLSDHAKKEGIVIPQLADTAGAVMKDYGVMATPTTYLISEDNRVLFSGVISTAEQLKELEPLLAMEAGSLAGS